MRQAMDKLVAVDDDLFLWSEDSDPEDDDRDEDAAFSRKMFFLQYLSRHAWKKSSRIDVKASRLASSERISATEVLEALRRIPSKHWKNTGRANVRPEGVEHISSITLGLVACQSSIGRPVTSAKTRLYKNLAVLLVRFWKQHIQEEREEGNLPGCQSIVCTSIQMNRNYAAREHVDGNNMGPSWIIGLGDWTAGGELFVEDPRGCESHVLSCDIPGRYRKGDVCRGTSLDVKNRWARFDGCRMHFVRPYSGGDRFSLVFFATTRLDRAPEKAKNDIALLGFPLPERQAQVTRTCICSEVSALKLDNLGRVIDISSRLCSAGHSSSPWLSTKKVPCQTRINPREIRRRIRLRLTGKQRLVMHGVQRRINGKRRIP